MLNDSSPLLPIYAAKGRFCFVRRWSTAVSPWSSTDCMHNRKIVLGFAKHIRENMGTFAQLFPAFSQNSATFSAFFPPFSPLSVSVRGTVAGLSHSTPFSRHCSPCASVHLSFAHRRLTIRQHVAPFYHTHAEVFFVFLTAQRQKTTTSKHILTEYVRHDTYFLSFLSLTDKKVVHLQRIDK